MKNWNLHSTVCLIIMRSELIWSTHDLLGLKPFCSVRSVVFRTGATLSRMRTFTTELKRVIPRKFLQRLRSPFLGFDIISSSFQLLGILLFFNISRSLINNRKIFILSVVQSDKRVSGLFKYINLI